MKRTTQNIQRLILTSLVVLFFAGCSSQFGRYQHANDSTPARQPSTAELKDAVPRIEAKSRGGNKNYTVRGKSYQVLSTAENFEQTGIASWYGKKFHGHLTSNGEIYDMYAMSAAHKNLPLPTYLEVENLANNKKVIVRVNDRGPFYQSRIIDLSYSAAFKLGMLKTGTANVRIKSITDPAAYKKQKEQGMIASQAPASVSPAPASITEPSNLPKQNENIYIQVFATKNKQVAEDTAKKLVQKYKQNVVTPEHQGIYRIQLGPFNEQQNIEPILSTLKQTGYPNAYRRKILQ